MLKVILSGCSGKMGGVITSIINADENAKIVAGVDPYVREDLGYPVYPTFDNLPESDVIIDFSIPQATFNILEFELKTNTPMVIATTGFTDEQNKKIEEYSEKIAIFKSSNDF